MSEFIGRAEYLTSHIIERLYPGCIIAPQYPIQKLLSSEEYEKLDTEIQKHRFDFAIILQRTEGFTRQTFEIIVEVNFKHGEKAGKKWWRIFVPLIKKYGRTPVTIDDHDCRHLFQLDNHRQHRLKWDDFRDIIDSLEKAGVKP